MRRPGTWRAERSGLTFLELATVLAVVGILSAIGASAAHEARKNACRVRARAALDQVYRMEVLHAAMHGGYTADFAALRSIGLAEHLDPLYRFTLAVPSREGFACLAAANLDRDARQDSLSVDDTGVVRLLCED